MNIFNSLGSNYNLKIAFQTLFANNKKENKEKLVDFLENKYGGEVHLFYKGREALEAALKLLDLPNYNMVAINGFTCLVVCDAVKRADLRSIYLDIESSTLNFTANALEVEIRRNPKLKVVVVQHTLGISSEIKKISEICKSNGLVLIEDLAHSVGGVYGDLVTLSFSQDKIIDSVSGGALIIKNKNLQKKVTFEKMGVGFFQQVKDRLYPLLTMIIRVTYPTGFGKVFHKTLKRMKFLSVPIEKLVVGLRDLPNWYCSVALSYLENLDEDIKHREKIVRIYKKDLVEKIRLNGSPLIRFPIIVEERSELIKVLKKRGVYVSDIWYDTLVTSKKRCPVSNRVSGKILNLPTHKNISEKKAKKICVIINQWINSQ
ncbi:DegT/DnrJ/EryC1/StrS aminotransferase family protein [Candidatus Microgenomates bacterium]|nr:DegT/DnrJ/EryC1/StrS aminotransferase family protein [Candidatus Microgenomates bacterium]